VRSLDAHPVADHTCPQVAPGLIGVFERFTESAAEAIVLAREEAGRIGTEHMLLRSEIEQVFGILPTLGSSVDDILAVARLHLSNAEAEALVVWIARRVGRAQALAGDRGAYGRLEHVLRYWLSEGERSALLAWLSHRIALGRSPVPDSR
jgi:hypothetical protein